MLDFLRVIFNFFVRFTAVVLCGVFILAVTMVLALLTFDAMLLSPDVYLAALERERIYERLPGLAAEQIYMQMHSPSLDPALRLPNLEPDALACVEESLDARDIQAIREGSREVTEQERAVFDKCAGVSGKDGPPAYFVALSIDQWASILARLLPPEWLKAQASSVLSQLFALFDTPGAPLHIYLSMEEVKERFAGEPGVDAALQLLDAQPACTLDQIAESLIGGGMPECKPPPQVIDQIKPVLKDMLAQAAENIPDQVDLLEPFTGAWLSQLEESNWPVGPRELLQIGRWVVRLSPLIWLVLLGAIALLVVRSWKDLLRWWGVPVLLSGVSAFLMAVAVWVGLDVLVSLARESLPGTISPSVFDTLAGVMAFITHRYALVLGIAALLVGGAGVGMLAVSFFAGRGKRMQKTSARDIRRRQNPKDVGGAQTKGMFD